MPRDGIRSLLWIYEIRETLHRRQQINCGQGERDPLVITQNFNSQRRASFMDVEIRRVLWERVDRNPVDGRDR